MLGREPAPNRAAGLAYERIGEGPPLVLIHGLGATRAIWRPQLELLAAERDVIAVDLPGFGASPMLTEPATPWALGAAVAQLCGELDVERPHLAGNSLGGWVALEMAKAGHAASTCLISSPSMPRSRRFRWFRSHETNAVRWLVQSTGLATSITGCRAICCPSRPIRKETTSRSSGGSLPRSDRITPSRLPSAPA